MAKTPGQKRARKSHKWSMREYKRRLAIANEEGRLKAKTPAPKQAVYPQHIPAGMFAKTKLPEGLGVPVPTEKVIPEDVCYASREGQGVFREIILAAYGQCAITGCTVKASLEAAHIIPFVDGRSNVVTNGLCLRADIHRLYDRNLITIGIDFVVRLSSDLRDSHYSELHLTELKKPIDADKWPNPKWLSVRHLFIVSGE